MYESKSNSEFDKAELLLYEEVTRMPPFKRRTLALIGTHGVGRRTLKNRLINSDPEKFGAVIPSMLNNQLILSLPVSYPFSYSCCSDISDKFLPSNS